MDSDDKPLCIDSQFTFALVFPCSSQCSQFMYLTLLPTGALLFFALLGLSGCFITCYDRRVRNDLAQPCRELCLCCCQPGYESAIVGSLM